MDDEELFKTTRELLANRSVKTLLKQIAADTKLGYPWICAFHLGKIEGKYKGADTINKVKKLHAYLSKQATA